MTTHLSTRFRISHRWLSGCAGNSSRMKGGFSRPVILTRASTATGFNVVTRLVDQEDSVCRPPREDGRTHYKPQEHEGDLGRDREHCGQRCFEGSFHPVARNEQNRVSALLKKYGDNGDEIDFLEKFIKENLVTARARVSDVRRSCVGTQVMLKRSLKDYRRGATPRQ